MQCHALRTTVIFNRDVTVSSRVFSYDRNVSDSAADVVIRVFDETLFRIFAKHETRKNAPVFRKFREFHEFRKIKFSRFSCFAKVIIFAKLAKLD